MTVICPIVYFGVVVSFVIRAVSTLLDGLRLFGAVTVVLFSAEIQPKSPKSLGYKSSVEEEICLRRSVRPLQFFAEKNTTLDIYVRN